MYLRRCLVHLFILLVGITSVKPAQARVGFQPVSPEELKMTGDPKAPGAPAIVLYREVDRDDFGTTSHGGISIAVNDHNRSEDNYYRIKILNEEGRKYGNVEIPILNFVGSVGAVNARTIRPDGSIATFDGQVLEKVIYKNKDFHYTAKTFVLPDVQPGCIIEYYYTVYFNERGIYFSNWVVSDQLFTKHAKFSLRPYKSDYFPLSYRWTERLPAGTASTKEGPDGIVRLDVDNIGAFQPEEYMPPESELKARVDFIYSYDPFEMDPNKYWKKVGKKRNEQMESFIGKRGAMEQAVGQIVSAGDTPEVKLQKIYTRVQQLHNTTYEPQKTEQEEKRENKKTDENADDIWKRGYGTGQQIAQLYLALARAAGIEANCVLISERSNYFFNPQSMESNRFDASIVVAKLNGKDVFIDPGVPFAPFGLLSWEKTGVQGLKLDKDGGSFVQTPLPESSASHIERKGNLKLSDNGDLEGKITVTYTGLESLQRRMEERNGDDTTKKKFLEDEMKSYIPVAAEIELSNKPDWTSPAVPLVAEFSVKVPGWAVTAGRRILLPIGLFSGEQKHLFASAQRVYPVYFEFLSQNLDDVTIEFPSNWQVASIPKPLNQDLHVVGYAVSAENDKSTLHLKRKLDINILQLDTKYYSPLRSFFQGVRTGDEQQIVLQPSASAMVN
jgi:hypothetical protein